jgi:hypothetical protein
MKTIQEEIKEKDKRISQLEHKLYLQNLKIDI